MQATSVGSTVRGRFAPTPSGRMHLGNVFSALMAWLSVRSTGGTLVLRIEDLDPRAQRREVAELLMRDLEWLGLTWDEGPYFQSERTAIYRAAVDKLASQGLTYPCFCTRAELHAASAPHASDGTYLYQGTCRNLSAEEIARRAAVRRRRASRCRRPAIRQAPSPGLTWPLALKPRCLPRNAETFSCGAAMASLPISWPSWSTTA